MPSENLRYICPNCTNQIREPNASGRSWCKTCEQYLIPLPVDPESLEVAPEGGDLHNYRYNTWRPRTSSYQIGETPEHRFMFVKRTDITVKGPKGVSYQPKCTCKTWKHQYGFTTRQRAYRLWQSHMAEVEKQGTLNVGVL